MFPGFFISLPTEGFNTGCGEVFPVVFFFIVRYNIYKGLAMTFIILKAMVTLP